MRICKLPSCGHPLVRRGGETSIEFGRRRYCTLKCYSVDRRDRESEDVRQVVLTQLAVNHPGEFFALIAKEVAKRKVAS
jgi:hypothetical protein